MKRIISWTLALFLFLSFASGAWASEGPAEPAEMDAEPVEMPAEPAAEPAEDGEAAGTCGEGLTWTLSNDGVLTITGSGWMEDSGWYRNDQWDGHSGEVLRVEIGAGVNYIGDFVFYNCTALRAYSVSEDNPVYSAKDGVLFSKDGRRLLLYPVGRTDTAYTVPAGTVKLEEWAFYSNPYLESITLPDGLAEVDDYSLRACTALKSLDLPDSVTRIGDWALWDCDSLEELTIPKSVTYLGDGAVGSCDVLRSAAVDADIEGLYMVFMDCQSLLSVTLPEGLRRVSSMSFVGCRALRSVTIPVSVTRIENAAFRDCTSLSEVRYDGTTADWDAILIEEHNTPLLWARSDGLSGQDGGSLSWTLEKSGVLTISGAGDMEPNDPSEKTALFRWHEYSDYIREIVIEPGVTGIADGAFRGSGSLAEITIPESVTSIGSNAFAYCESLAQVYYGGTEKQWDAIDLSEYGNGFLFKVAIRFGGADEPGDQPEDVNDDGNVNAADAAAVLAGGEYAPETAAAILRLILRLGA